MSSTLGDRIKQLRFERGITQDILADSVGVTKASISNYERNIRNPQYNVLKDIAEALRVPVSELLVQTPTSQSEDDGKDAKKQPYDKRSKRLKKIIAAFDQLSDEAQIKAIEHMEELALIPEYQRPLPGVLQQYINAEYNLVYEPIENKKFHKIYTEAPFSAEQPLIVSVEHIILNQQTLYPQEEAAHWDFFYYSSESAVLEDSCIIEGLLKKITYPIKIQDSLSFVFDNESTLNSFLGCFGHLLKTEKTAQIRLGFQGMSTLFMLIDKRTGRIKTVKKFEFKSEKGLCQQMLPGVLQQYVREKYSFVCELVENNVYMQPSFSEESPFSLQVRRMLLQQQEAFQEEARHWEFLYYSGEKPFNDVLAAVEILKDLTYPVENQNNLSFIFDDSETSSTFYAAFLALLARSPKIHPGFLGLDTLFFLIDKQTGGIKNVDVLESEFKTTAIKRKLEVKMYDRNEKIHFIQFNQWNEK